MTTNPDPPTKLIRNSTAEFLIFTAQEDGASIEARYEDETIWLTQARNRTKMSIIIGEQQDVSRSPFDVRS